MKNSKPVVKIWLTVINSQGATLGYEAGAPFVPIETRVLYENGQVYGIENLRPFFTSDAEFSGFVKMIVTQPEGQYRSFTWQHDK